MSGRGRMAALLCVLGLAAGFALTGCGEKPQGQTKEPGETPPAVTEVKAPAEEPLPPAKPGTPNPCVVKMCAKAPVVDGDLSDPCWKAAEVPGAWVNVYTGQVAKPMPKAYVCYDSQNVYVAFMNPEPKMGSLVANATVRDGTVWEDDSNELFIDPTAGKEKYCQFIVNTAGVLYDSKGHGGPEWNSNAKAAVKKAADGWSVEIAIPLSDLGVTGSPKGQTWTGNFCRNRQTEGEAEAQAWSDTRETFHNPGAFGKLMMK